MWTKVNGPLSVKSHKHCYPCKHLYDNFERFILFSLYYWENRLLKNYTESRNQSQEEPPSQPEFTDAHDHELPSMAITSQSSFCFCALHHSGSLLMACGSYTQKFYFYDEIKKQLLFFSGISVFWQGASERLHVTQRYKVKTMTNQARPMTVE